MNRPESLTIFEPIDLKLGIKSSLPNVKSTLALVVLLWRANKMKSVVCYSKQTGDGIVLSDSSKMCLENYLISIFGEEIGFSKLLGIVNDNQLFKSQLEALIVALELIWKIAKISFVDSSFPSSYERTGKKRYIKQISYSSNIDLVDSLIELDEKASVSILLSWLGYDGLEVDSKIEMSFKRMFMVFSEEAIYKLKDGSFDVVFGINEIYKKLLQTDDFVDINGDGEPKGTLRILKSMLSEKFNPYINSTRNGLVIEEGSRSLVGEYQKRVELFLKLSATKAMEGNTSVFEPNDINDKPNKTRLNVVFFGAPGTGKSRKLKDKADEKFNKQGSINNNSSDFNKKRINNVRSNSMECIALGYCMKDELRGKKPKDIQNAYGCDASKAFRLYQGARISDKIDSFDEYNEERDGIEFLREQFDKIEPNDMQVSAAAFGLKFNSILFSADLSSTSKINDFFSIDSTSSKGYWINAGLKIDNFDCDAISIEKENYVERVTFYPAYTYAQFVGCYKPIMRSNDEGNDEISYEYVPGPFIRTYANAMLNYEKHWKDEKGEPDPDQRIFLLIIEELNRANAPAVFGDVFQLLDRDEEGKSEYPVKASEDLRKYLKSAGIEKTDELCIPSNMYIWATMNSADQGVQPLDAAFKRRWDMEYVGLYDNTELDDICIPSIKEGEKWEDASRHMTWLNFRKVLNACLLGDRCKVHEDRCIGPFFIKRKIIENANKNKEGKVAFKECFENKLLMYLYEDIVKMNPGKLFKSGYKTYSDIREGFEKVGFGIFVEDIKFEIEDNDSENKSGDADDSNNADVLNNPSDGNP